MAIQSVLLAAGGHLGTGILDTTINPLFRDLAYAANELHPSLIIPSVHAARVWTSGLLTENDLRIYGLAGGIVWGGTDRAKLMYRLANGQLEKIPYPNEDKTLGWGAFLESMTWSPPWEMIVPMINRGMIDFKLLDYFLSRLGISDNTLRDEIHKLRFVIPGPSDLTRFAIREAFSEQAVIDRLQLDAEYPPDYAFWAGRQGLGQVSAIDPVTKERKTADMAKLYWRAHWQLPSPTQAYEMLHRLRPNRINRFAAQYPDARPFQIDDIRLLLRAQDYSPEWRDRLAAINSKVIGRIDIRRLRQEGVENDAEIKERFLDLGYIESDAQALTNLNAKLANRTLNQRTVNLTRSKIIDAYRTGYIERAQVVQMFKDIGLDDFEASVATSNADLEINVGKVKKIIASIRRQFLRGMITEIDVRTQLSGMQITQRRINDYVQIWTAEKLGSRREVSLSVAKNAFVDNLINASEFRRRMDNLGYPPKEQQIIIDQSVSQININNQQQAVRQARNQAERQRAIRAQQREIERNLERVRRNLIRSGSESQLKRWLKLGLILPQVVYNRLRIFGYSVPDANRFIVEAGIENFQGAEQEAKERLKELQSQQGTP